VAIIYLCSLFPPLENIIMCAEGNFNKKKKKEEAKDVDDDGADLEEKETYVLGRAKDNHLITGSLRPNRTTVASSDSHNKQVEPYLIVGVEGEWYDVTKFAQRHPGGDVIYEFHNRDATGPFLAYHNRKVLKMAKKIISNKEEERQEPPPTPTPGKDKVTSNKGGNLDDDWIKLNDEFEKLGLYEPTMLFLWSRWLIVVGFLVWTTVQIYLYNANKNNDNYGSYVHFPLASLGLALIWQQCGFLMHDAMHNHHFQSRRIDQLLGQLYGSVAFGISANWWRDEHNEHHLFTNTYVDGVGCSDPQMREEIWVQDEALLPFAFQPILNFMLKYQQYYFLPILILVGSIGIRIDSIVCTRRIADLTCMAVHYAWVGMLVAAFPTWKEGILFYVVACWFAGVLSIQLLVSHYSKPFIEKRTSKQSGYWARRQIDAVVDIVCPWWLDWFFGGLHLHSPHHLFPRLNRCHYRRVYPAIEAMCHKHNVTLDKLDFVSAVVQTLKHLGEIGKDNNYNCTGKIEKQH
jgi:fatty acid desaturase/cytochrome b involved in lipid metabolism